MNNVHPIFDEALKAMSERDEDLAELYDKSEGELSPLDELRRQHGKIPTGMRPGYVIVAAIKSSSLTLTELNNILDVVTSRVCLAMREYPELEETAHDLALTCNNFTDAQDKIDERLYQQHMGRCSNGER